MKTSTLTILISIFCLFFFHQSTKAQNSDSTELANLSAELDALFANEEDSLSLFALIDSLLTIPTTKNSLSLRVGYSSRVTSAGRDFGVDQQGLSPGISYYHKSGLYGDITGVWNSELDPKYYLTLATIGYLGSVGKKWSYSLSYDHSFYHSTDSSDIFPLTNSFSASVSHDFKYFYSGLSYAYSFGDETANQLTWNLTGVIQKKGFKPFKSISILPTFSVLWGNQTLTYNIVDAESIIENLSDREIQAISGRRDWTEFQTNRLREIRDKLISNTPLTDREQSGINFFANRFITEEAEEVSSFGLLNYYLSLPVSFNSDKLSILLSYNYNIPKELPESVLEVTESNGYFGFTVSYNIGF